MLDADGVTTTGDGEGAPGGAARDFPSLEAYIYGTTARIWEGRGLHLIERYYGSEAIVRTPMGVTHGVPPVIAATRATLHEFPDRRLLGEDVIWCARHAQDDRASDGSEGAAWRTDAPHYSSHRIVSPMTHAGDGAFGAATHRALRVRTIADCVVADERVVEEWLVRDHSGILAQLGTDLRETARAQARALREAGTPVALTPDTDPEGAYRSPTCTDDAALAYADTLARAWRGDLAAIAATYDEAVALELYGARSASGIGAATRHWLSLGAAMPDAAFSVDHLIGRADPGLPHRVAVRWTATGTHSGNGAFGAPTGAPLYVLGITHVELARGRVHREWTLIDELAIHRQIADHLG